jgi:hypothetical protein
MAIMGGWILWQGTLNWLLPRYFGHPYGILNGLIPSYQAHLDKKLHIIIIIIIIIFWLMGLKNFHTLLKKQEKTLGDTI